MKKNQYQQIALSTLCAVALLSSALHASLKDDYEERTRHRLKASDAGMTVSVETLALIAENILANGALEYRQEASVACVGFLADLTLSVIARASIASAIIFYGAPEHRLEAIVAGVGFLENTKVPEKTRERIARDILFYDAPEEYRRKASAASVGLFVDTTLYSDLRCGSTSSNC